jgi:hypothetical protein
MGGMPLLVRYISQMIHPGMTPTTTDPNNPQPARPTTRGDATLQFMGEFLANMSQGFAAAGHGPGANIRGFAGATQAPYQRELAGYQLGQQQQVQQAQIAEQQARAQQAQAQAELMRTGTTIMTPYGPQVIPASQAGGVLGSLLRSSAAAQIRTGADAVKKALGEASDAFAKGDTATYQQKLKEANDLATAGKAAPGASSLWGKLSPEMAATGVPPDPKNFPGGMNDPNFMAAVRDYGQKVTDLKQRNLLEAARQRGISYAYGRAMYQQIPTLDQETQNIGFSTALEIAKNPSRYAPMTEGDKLMMKNAIFEDIRGASGNLRRAMTVDPTTGRPQNVTFGPAQVAKLTAAMDVDPSGGVLRTEMNNMIKAGGKYALNPQQQATVIAMQQAVENAYALRGVAGFGAGSDDLRKAIKNTLPGPTSSPGYSLQQLNAFDQQVDRLQRGLPFIPLRGGGPSRIPAPGGGAKPPLGSFWKGAPPPPTTP